MGIDMHFFYYIPNRMLLIMSVYRDIGIKYIYALCLTSDYGI